MRKRALFNFKALRRFGRAKRGTAAVEFGLVAVPFFLLTFGLAEVAFIGFAQTSLNFATSEVGRLIRTGQAQETGLTKTQIEAQLCNEINSFLVMTCGGNLYIDVDRFDSFVDASNGANSALSGGNFNVGGMGYTPGVASDIIVVRAYYRWKILTPMFSPIFQNISGGQRVLVSTMMFRNEPF